MDAIQEFWMSEDLLEQLLPMLDPPTTVAFASVNPLAVSVLFRPLAWRRFLKRSFKPTGSSKQDFQNAHMISDLLEMANSKESRLLGSKAARESLSLQLWSFVDHICQVFPGMDEKAAKSHLAREARLGKVEEIKLLLGGNSKSVSLDGFLILDRVEWYMGSNAIVVEEMTLDRLADFKCAEALADQITRQQTKVKMVKIHNQTISSLDCHAARKYVDNIFSIIRHSSSWSLNRLWFHGFNKESRNESIWSNLAEVSSKGRIGQLSVDALALGCRDDVRKVWLATKEMIIHVGSLPKTYARENQSCYAYIRQEEGENGWARILKMIEEKDQIIATRK